MKKGSLELTSRQIVILILVIVILAVVLILTFGFYDQLKNVWTDLGGKGQQIGSSVVG